MLKNKDAIISIIVPVYNVRDYLEKCLDSLIYQTLKQIEIILVDDGSTDDSLEICRKYQEKDSRITVISQKNGGLSAARNSGIEVAKGKYLMFVDSDDFVAKNYCKSALEGIKRYQCDILLFDLYYVVNGVNNLQTQNYKNGILSKKSAMSIIIGDSHAVNKIYTKSVFSKIRFPVGKNYEDILTMYRLVDNASRVAYMAQPLYYYVQRKNSIMSSLSEKNLGFLLKANIQRLKFYKEKFPSLIPLVEREELKAAIRFIVYSNKDNTLNTYADRILKNSKKLPKMEMKYVFAINMYKWFPNVTLKLLKSLKM